MRRLRRFLALVMGLLGEISDQNAYNRYLRREGRAATRESWKQFHQQRLHSKFIRPKCC